MAKNWGESAGDAFLQSLDTGMKSNFERWKTNQENATKLTQMEQLKQVYGITPEGGLGVIGQVPKGSQVITPASMMSPQDKAQITMEMGAKGTALKEAQVNLSKVKRLAPIISSVETEWMKTNPVSEKMGGRAIGLQKSILSPLQLDKNVSSYKSFVKGMRAQLARAMGDVGNLSEPEQKAAMDLVPAVGDTLEVGQEKLNKVRAFIGNLEQGNADAAKALLGKGAMVMPPELQKAIEASGIKVKSFRKIK
jgi:hypothetical protein